LDEVGFIFDLRFAIGSMQRAGEDSEEGGNPNGAEIDFFMSLLTDLVMRVG
jgi:hypothetical protein